MRNSNFVKTDSAGGISSHCADYEFTPDSYKISFTIDDFEFILFDHTTLSKYMMGTLQISPQTVS